MDTIFIAVLVAVQALVIFLSFVIYRTLVAAFGIGGLGLFVFLMGLSFTFIFTSILAARYKNRFVRYFHFLSMYWLALIAPLFAASIAFVLIENIAIDFRLQVTLAAAGLISFAGAALLYAYGVWNAHTIRVKRITVKISGLPEWWRGKSFVFISDVHFGNEYGARFAEKIVREIASLAPQAVFIGGDLFDGVKCDPDALLLPFRKLQAPYGTYFVSGNHEYIRDSDLFLGAVRRAGITALKNEKKEIQGIDFWGVDFEDTHKKKDFKKVIKGMAIDPRRTNVLVKHIPNHLNVAERAGVSFQISGHTHRGQMFPLSYLTHKVFKGYDYGLKQFGKMAVYTSSGVGAAPAPFRFGTKSEIVLVELE